MKKIFLSLLIVTMFTINSFSQYMREITLVNDYQLASADTAFVYSTAYDYTWGLIVKWSTIGGTPNVKFSIRVAYTSSIPSYNSTDWVDYAGSVSYTMTASSGICAFEDNRTAFNFIQLRIQRNNGTGGHIYSYLTLNPNRK